MNRFKTYFNNVVNKVIQSIRIHFVIRKWDHAFLLWSIFTSFFVIYFSESNHAQVERQRTASISLSLITWHDESSSTTWSFSLSAAHIIFDAITNALEFSKHAQKYNELTLISFIFEFIKTAHYFTYVIVFWDCFTVIILWRLLMQYNAQWLMYIMNKMWFNSHMFQISYSSYFSYWRRRNLTRVKSLFEICRYEYMTMTTQLTRTRKLTFKSHHLFRLYRRNLMICERLIFFKFFMRLFERFTSYEDLHVYNKKKHSINYVEKDYIFSFIFDRW
jgi:hypothetical protein